jgi:Fe-S-cluster containining protein
MSTVSDNPCAACSTNRGCCTLKGWCGLMLTQDEFERHFKSYADELFIRLSDNYIVISTKEGRVCPHLQADGSCRIYQNRAIDCRLFPYVMRFVSVNAKKVKLAFHTRSDCPKKTPLLIPEAEARALVTEFGKKVFGEDKTIVVVREKGLLSRLLIRIEKIMSRHRFK